MKYCLTILLLLLTNFSFSAPDVRTGYIYVKNPAELKKILKNARLPDSLVEDKNFIKQILKNNPHLDSNQVLGKNTRIYVEIPYKTKLVARSKLENKSKKSQVERKIASVKSERKEVFDYGESTNSKTTLTAFYTNSIGEFSEEVGGITATSNQNSPITLGLSVGHNISENYSYSGSLYLSTLEGTASESLDTEVDIPNEWGITNHLNFKNKFIFTPFIGFEAESFSTFNTDELSSGEELSTREHQFLYATAGFSKVFELANRFVFFKFGIGQTLASQSSRNSLLSDEQFSGNKVIGFLSTKIYKKVSAHFLYKQHFMQGPTDLNITRYGVGLGYTFF